MKGLLSLGWTAMALFPRIISASSFASMTAWACKRASRLACSAYPCMPTVPRMAKVKMTMATSTSSRLKPFEGPGRWLVRGIIWRKLWRRAGCRRHTADAFGLTVGRKPALCAGGFVSMGLPMSDIITAAITEALDLAHQGLYRTSPNPRVGCVIADAAGVVIGRGSTGPAGGAHAEIMALRNAAAGGHSVRGATAYVTLEPCSHHGRTGPCCDALVAAGIAKVVASLTDPNPLVAGQGFARLRAAGVAVQVGPGGPGARGREGFAGLGAAGVAVQVGPGAQAARELNVGFFSRMLRHRPWVRMKLAASLDGVTALADGSSQWITGPAARADGHAWRARACALLTGIGTVLADDPRLDVRALHTERQPALVLLDSALRVPLDACIFAADRAVHIYAAAENDAKRRALEQRGATLAVLPDSRGRGDLAAMLHDLARRQGNELDVEAGQQLNGALLRQGLVDELLVYLAPKLIGPGLGMAQLAPLAAPSQAQALDFHGLERVGEDVRILARWRDREPFWG